MVPARSPVVRAPVILGAGLSGLAAARALAARGRAPVVLERAPTPGGLTRTVNIGEFCFDYTGHFLHLAHYASPAAIPFAGLRDEDWMTVARRSSCLVGGRLVPAPIQYHMGDLPEPERSRCIESYEQRPVASGEPPANFRDYLIAGFGQQLADLFLIPQNEKTMATPLGRLSPDAVKRFFPAPDEGLVRAGFGGVAPVAAPASAGAGYNARFWYPRAGGIERLVQGFTAGLTDLRVNQEVVALDLPRRELRTRTGEELRWDVLLTSAPLNDLCRMTGDAELVAAAARLSHSSTVTFNIGLRGEPPAGLRGLHWIYTPNRGLPFYRVGFYSEISAGTCASGMSSMYVEVGLPGGQAHSLDVTGNLQPRVIAALEDLGWVDPAAIQSLAVHTIQCAYVHHTPERESVVRGVLERLRSHGVEPIGRYGLWDYTSMEDSIRNSIATAEALVK